MMPPRGDHRAGSAFERSSRALCGLSLAPLITIVFTCFLPCFYNCDPAGTRLMRSEPEVEAPSAAGPSSAAGLGISGSVRDNDAGLSHAEDGAQQASITDSEGEVSSLSKGAAAAARPRRFEPVEEQYLIPLAQGVLFGDSPRVGGLTISFATAAVLAAIIVLALAQRRAPGRKEQIYITIGVAISLMANVIQWFAWLGRTSGRGPYSLGEILSGHIDFASGNYGWVCLSMLIAGLVLRRGMRSHGWTAFRLVCLAYSMNILTSSVALLTLNALLLESAEMDNMYYGAYIHIVAAGALFAVGVVGVILVSVGRRRAGRQTLDHGSR